MSAWFLDSDLSTCLLLEVQDHQLRYDKKRFFSSVHTSVKIFFAIRSLRPSTTL